MLSNAYALHYRQDHIATLAIPGLVCKRRRSVKLRTRINPLTSCDVRTTMSVSIDLGWHPY